MRTARLGAAAIVAILLAAILAIDLLDDSAGEEAAVGPDGARVLSESELRRQELEHRAYWLGPRAGARYELSTTEDGAIFLRYLTGEAEAGSSRSDFLTVGAYVVPDATQALRRAAEDDDGAVVDRGDHSILAAPEETSAYVVLEEAPDLQIEIYSPVPGQARALALAKAPVPVGQGAPSE